MILMGSPPTPTTRLMKFVFERSLVGSAHAWLGGLGAPHSLTSAPTGGGETTMSPTFGEGNRSPMRLTSTRWPTSSVGSIDSLGMRYGLCTKGRVSRGTAVGPTTS